MTGKTRVRAGAAAAAVVAAVGFAAPADAAGVTVPAGFAARLVAQGTGVTGPDDLVTLDGNLYVGYQNGVGTMGEPAPSGTTASTLVEYRPDGHQVAQWSLPGKIDGLGADRTEHRIVATVNEDGNSSLYTVGDGQVRHYAYDSNPLPHGGGTDSVTVHDGTIYLAASNPAADANGSTGNRPAMYTARLAGGTAKLTPVFPDDQVATNRVTGAATTLNLTDPDSSGWVPRNVPGVGDSLMLVAQGDQQLVFVKDPGQRAQRASVLPVSAALDDTVFAPGSHSTLFVVDTDGNRIYAITGPFQRGQAFASAAGLSTVNLANGQVTAFGSGIKPKGLVFAGEEDAGSAE